MKNVRKVFSVLIGCLILNSVFSQHALRLQLAPGPIIPPTADTGSVFSFNVWIINDSATEYQGQIGFGYRVDTTTYLTSSTTSGLEFTVVQDSIQPFDTIGRTITVHVNEPRLKAGPSVVVIWPIAAGSFITDSLTFNIVVTIPTGIEELSDERLRLIINGNALVIQRGEEIYLRRVRIYNAGGREVLSKTDPTDHIPLPAMDSGIYFAEFSCNNNRRKVFRFFRGLD